LLLDLPLLAVESLALALYLLLLEPQARLQLLQFRQRDLRRHLPARSHGHAPRDGHC
jgi:hypothetical protein